MSMRHLLRAVATACMVGGLAACATSGSVSDGDEQAQRLQAAKTRHEAKEARRAAKRAEAAERERQFRERNRLGSTDGLSKAQIQETITEHIREIQDCYEEEVVRNAAAGGRVVLHWVIEPDGTVSDIDASPTELPPPQLACMADAMRSWRFPPTDGRRVEVGYPFIFKTLCLPADVDDPAQRADAGGCGSGGTSRQ